MFSFKSRLKRFVGNKEYDIVIHTEGNRYHYVFRPLVDLFLENNIQLTIITHDKDDAFSQIKHAKLEIIYAGNDYATFSLLNNLHANIVISTTPHLDIYMWKKSKYVKKYIHIFHSPTGIDFYEKYALSYYDIIFTAVTNTDKAQEYLDKKRKLPSKQFYNIGCLYYDSMLAEVQHHKRENFDKTILYAPSWGNRSSLYTIGFDLLTKLMELNYKVIFRPHPQSFISDKTLLDSIFDQFKTNGNFLLDNSKMPLESMMNSDLLITDFSGILFDYYYLVQKPILLASDSVKTNGYEVEELPQELMFDKVYSEKFSEKLNIDLLENHLDKIASRSQPPTTFPLHSIKESYVLVNFGQAAKVAYDTILQIHTEIRND